MAELKKGAIYRALFSSEEIFFVGSRHSQLGAPLAGIHRAGVPALKNSFKKSKAGSRSTRVTDSPLKT